MDEDLFNAMLGAELSQQECLKELNNANLIRESKLINAKYFNQDNNIQENFLVNDETTYNSEISLITGSDNNSENNNNNEIVPILLSEPSKTNMEQTGLPVKPIGPKKRRPSPESLSKLVGISINIAPKKCFLKKRDIQKSDDENVKEKNSGYKRDRKESDFDYDQTEMTINNKRPKENHFVDSEYRFDKSNNWLNNCPAKEWQTSQVPYDLDAQDDDWYMGSRTSNGLTPKSMKDPYSVNLLNNELENHNSEEMSPDPIDSENNHKQNESYKRIGNQWGSMFTTHIRSEEPTEKLNPHSNRNNNSNKSNKAYHKKSNFNRNSRDKSSSDYRKDERYNRNNERHNNKNNRSSNNRYYLEFVNVSTQTNNNEYTAEIINDTDNYSSPDTYTNGFDIPQCYSMEEKKLKDLEKTSYFRVDDDDDDDVKLMLEVAIQTDDTSKYMLNEILQSSAYYASEAQQFKQNGRSTIIKLDQIILFMQTSICYIQEANAFEKEKKESSTITKKLNEILALCKNNGNFISQCIEKYSKESVVINWNILLVLNLHIMSYIYHKLYLIRRSEVAGAKTIIDDFMMDIKGHDETKLSSRVSSALQFYITYMEHFAKSYNYCERANSAINSNNLVSEFFMKLKFQIGEFKSDCSINFLVSYISCALEIIHKL